MYVTVGISQGDFVGNTDAVIQQAIDAVGAYGGGTVELGPGTWMLYDSVKLRSNVRLLGAGRETILRKLDEVASPAAVDPDYGQTKVTVEDASGFRSGMGIMVKDQASDYWTDCLSRITLVKGNVLYLDRRLIWDFTMEKGCTISNTFSPVLFYQVSNATVEKLTVDGNRKHNRWINGCIGGGIFLRETTNCKVLNCIVRDFNGDGVDAEINQGTVYEGCEATGMAGYGFHLGSGSARAVVRNNKAMGNDGEGLFLCWRVQESVFEKNELRGNGRDGISIGHKDTDNLFVDNVIVGNKGNGIRLRGEKPSNAGSRNTFRGNRIEDNRECGVYVAPSTTDITLEQNIIRDTRTGASRTQQVGILAEQGTARIRARGNTIQNNLKADVQGNVEVLAK